MITETILQQILTTIVGVVVTFVVSYIAAKIPQIITQAISYLKIQIDLMRSKFTAEQLAMFDLIVTQVIRAVEQKVITQELLDDSVVKKNKAIQMIQTECARLGIPFDAVAADRMIEAGIKQGLEQGLEQVNLPKSLNDPSNGSKP